MVFLSKKQIGMVSTVLMIVTFILYRIEGYNYISITLMLIITLIAGFNVFKKAFSALRYKIVSIDALVTIAVIGAIFIGEYWEAAAVVYLFMIGDYLESKTIEKTRNSIELLLHQQPSTARKIEDGKYVIVDAEEIQVGEHVVVFSGEKIPVDGTIIKGSASINQASINGESLPQDVYENDFVYATSVVESGYVVIVTVKEVDDTMFSRIIKLVEEAQDKKAKRQKLLERFSQYYTPAVILLAIIMVLVTKDINLSLTLLVIACPGALVISTPVSIVAGIGNGAKHGVLFKGGETVESLNKVDVVAFDKTGTLTIGKPKVMDYVSFSEVDALYLAAVGESYSQHPIALAIIEYANKTYPTIKQADDTEIFHGKGLRFEYEGSSYFLGNERLMKENNISLTKVEEKLHYYQKRKSSVVLLSDHQEILGLFAIEDQVREDSKQLIEQLKRRGIKTVMLTGDNHAIASAIATELNIDEIHSQLLPQDKADVIEKLQQKSVVAMVGDGVNDALALTIADVGIAMGQVGSDVAMESADVVLVNDDVSKISYALSLSKAIVKNMNINIIFAMIVVSFLLMGVIVKTVNLSLGMLVHELSVLLVIIHATTLLRFNVTSKV